MTATKIIFTATAPDGTVLKRTTTGMTYSHAVIGQDGAGKWILISCHSRLDLAQVARGKGNGRKVVPMARIEKTVKPMDPRTKEISGLRRKITLARKTIAKYEAHLIKLDDTGPGFVNARPSFERALERVRDWVKDTEARLAALLAEAPRQGGEI